MKILRNKESWWTDKNKYSFLLEKTYPSDFQVTLQVFLHVVKPQNTAKVISVAFFTIQYTSGSQKNWKCTSKHFDAKDTERITIRWNEADWKHCSSKNQIM